MKKIILNSAAAIALLSISMTSAEAITGEAVANPFFDDGVGGADYSNWTFNSPWRDNGVDANAVADLADFNAPGFIAALGEGRDLATAPEITGDAAFTDASNAILTGMTLNSPFMNLFGAITDPGEYNIFFELDIVTVGGDFRAQSQAIDVSTIGAPSSPALTTTWIGGGGFLGDPSLQAGGGIALSDITGITYKPVLNIVEANGGATAFLTADNLSVSYDVSFVPEPSSYALFAGLLGLGFVMVRKRR